MNHKLPCAIVRDLLPAYAEKLTEAETTAAVAEHLQNCPDCRRRLEDMQTPLCESPSPEDRAVDYLKTVRKRGRKQVVSAILLVLLAVFLTISLFVFVIGTPLTSSTVWIDAAMDEQDQVLHLKITSTGSADAFFGWKTTVEDGVLSITARKVLVSALHPSGFHEESIYAADLRQINLLDTVIWKDGTLLKDGTQRMFARRVRYVGDASAIGALSDALPLPQVPFTQALQTDAEPYGWTVRFDAPLSLTEQEQVRRAAPLTLALVENLGTFSWSYPAEDGAVVTESVMLDEVNALLPEKAAAYLQRTGRNVPLYASVKDYAQDVFSFQLLRNLFGV